MGLSQPSLRNDVHMNGYHVETIVQILSIVVC